LTTIPKADLLNPAGPVVINRTRFENITNASPGATGPGATPSTLAPVSEFGTRNHGVILATDLYSGTSVLHRYNVTNPGANSSTLSVDSPISVSKYWTTQNAHQPDGSMTLENFDDRIGMNNVYQVGNIIWAVSSIRTSSTFGNGVYDAIRWYEIEETNNIVLQSGTISDPHHDYIYPAIAANAAGEVVIGFSATGDSTTSDYPGAWYVAGTTAAGITTFGAPTALRNGSSNYNLGASLSGDPRNRWGDYSAISTDPANPSAFWIADEVAIPGDPAQTTRTQLWGTQISEIVFDNDGTANGALTVSEPPINGTSAELPAVVTGQASATVEVATFTHASGVEPAGVFTTMVDWGIAGHHSDSATVTQDLGGTYHVSATRPVFSPGTYAVNVSISENDASTTVTDSQVVNKADTSAAVVSSVNPSVFGQSVTFTAMVSITSPGTNAVANPTGMVTFLDGSTTIGTGTLDSSGQATLTTSGLSAGTHTITAAYGGDPNFAPSVGSLTQNVQYAFSGFLPPLDKNSVFGINRTIPIKFQLTDVNGALITSLGAVTSLQVAPVNPDNSLGMPFNPTPTPGTSLRNDGSQYIFNWQTKGLAAGTYEILLTLADATLHTKVLQLTKTGSSAGLTTVAAGGTGTAGGGLLGGDIDLYVDNTNGDLTADELARLQDAVNAANAVTEPYGVAVTEVTDPTLADVTLNMDTTSAVGGYADGVLGCTTDAGQITIINGWNFYAGSDGTQIGSAQYDFETVVEHELGHALGLGHSTDSASVMYATLNPGTVNRTLTTADLNVADTDTTGGCGLHAAVTTTPVTSNAPLVNGPSQEAFFAMFANPAYAPAVATNSSAPSAYDAVFANPIGDIGAAKFAALSATPIFGAPATIETADDAFSLSPEDGAGTPLSLSAPPTDRPDLQFDFILADGAILVEC
jgi:hypothetical protein